MVKVVWDKAAALQLKAAFEYINKDSPQNAQKIRLELLSTTEALASHPEKYPADKYKINNDGSYRAFEKYNFRLSYRVTLQMVKVLHLRSTKQMPLEY